MPLAKALTSLFYKEATGSKVGVKRLRFLCLLFRKTILGKKYAEMCLSLMFDGVNSAVIWQNPLSPLLHFLRKSSFSF